MESERLVRSLTEHYDHLFVADPRQYALGRPDGSYVRIRRPFTSAVRGQLLLGRVSVALYMLTPEGLAIGGVADSDQADGLADMQRLGFKLRQLGLNPLLEASRRGGHLRFFHEPLSPAVTSLFLKKTAALLEIEADLFPRGMGLSCVRAPLSVHPKTRDRYPLLDLDTLQPVAATTQGQLEFLASFERVDAQTVANALAVVISEGEVPKKRPGSFLPFEGKPDILNVVGRDLTLQRVGRHYRALCPFHEDQNPSLVLYPETGTFFCFGCHRTGDSITYLALRRGVRPGEILREIRKQAGQGR